MNTVIIGNSGSGKTWLANQLAIKNGSSIIHLDEIFWLPGGFNKKRTKEEVFELIEQSKENKNWIVEGVFGELAKHYLSEAKNLIWLNTPWDICKRRIILRTKDKKYHMNREQTEESIKALLIWAEAYYARDDFRSEVGHRAIFDQFEGNRVCLSSQEQVVNFLKAT